MSAIPPGIGTVGDLLSVSILSTELSGSPAVLPLPANITFRLITSVDEVAAYAMPSGPAYQNFSTATSLQLPQQYMAPATVV